MRILFIAMFILITFNVYSQNNLESNDSISVIGTALNAKAGAVIKTTYGKTFYIEDLAFWPENLYNKSVTVKGILKKEIFKQEDIKDDKGEWRQGMVGEKLTIIKPKWKER